MIPRWLVGTAVAVLFSVGVAAQTSPQGQVPTAATSLGSVTLPRAVMANGQTLSAGTYQVRLTAETAPPVTGIQTGRWVEFVRDGKVVGREVVVTVPAAEVKSLNGGAAGPRPSAGSSRVEMLKGDDFMRVWINRGGVNYLLHLPPAKG
jgi:hypothetical protein